ncbi:hypothetical protein [Pseudomonas aeruginosa]|uniref:hypothetical protein n=1 Tax=Pseudomonas aeruginosa TaxID=287 RepID=UPI002E2C9381|nr:hypothetical protein [Pseudomonas aeruginosa]
MSSLKDLSRERPDYHRRKFRVPIRLIEATVDPSTRRSQVIFEFSGLTFRLLISPVRKVQGVDFAFEVQPVGHDLDMESCERLAAELYLHRPPEIFSVVDQLR